MLLVVIAGVSGLARRGVWWRWAAVGVFVGAVAAVALSGPPGPPADRFEVNYPSNPGYGRADPPAGIFVDLSAGVFRTCGVRAGGEIECWGDDYGEPPAGRFVRVDVWEYAGRGNGCAVAVDASVTCWTTYHTEVNAPAYRQDYGQADAPPGSFVDVSVAGRFSCGLKADGSAVCWGDNIGDSYRPTGALEVPEGPFVEAHAGHPPCGLRESGEFVCWSDQAREVLWEQDHFFWDERLVAVSPGWGFLHWKGKLWRTPQRFLCGIRLDSTLVCSTEYSGYQPPEGEFLKVHHTSGPPCALRTNRTIVCWNYSNEPEWDVLLDPPLGEFTDIAVGAHHACAIRVDGTVACWGDNSDRPGEPCHGCPGLD